MENFERVEEAVSFGKKALGVAKQVGKVAAEAVKYGTVGAAWAGGLVLGIGAAMKMLGLDVKDTSDKNKLDSTVAEAKIKAAEQAAIEVIEAAEAKAKEKLEAVSADDWSAQQGYVNSENKKIEEAEKAAVDAIEAAKAKAILEVEKSKGDKK
jgi:hypothetical protein